MEQRDRRSEERQWGAYVQAIVDQMADIVIHDAYTVASNGDKDYDGQVEKHLTDIKDRVKARIDSKLGKNVNLNCISAG